MHVSFLLYMLAVLPVRTAFQIVPQPGTVGFTVDVCIDILIAIDIALNFKKFTKIGTELETDPKTLSKTYLTGWFALDLFAVMPFNYIAMALLDGDDDAENVSTHALSRYHWECESKTDRLLADRQEHAVCPACSHPTFHPSDETRKALSK